MNIILKTTPVKNNEYFDAERWVFNISFLCIEIKREVHWKSENKWSSGGRYYALSLSKHFISFGRSHAYYDGPHDAFSLGFLHYAWSGDWCDKCYGGNEN